MLRAEVTLAWKTQAGHRHNVEGLENEDAVFVTDEHPVFDAVLMVADGMGGHPRPREASQTAVRIAREFLTDLSRLESAGDASRALAQALLQAHRAVSALRTGNGGKNPGTTLSIAVVASGQLYVSHVGDGSVYLMRNGQVQTLAGGETHRAGNRPAQYLGQSPPIEPEQRRMAVAVGDRVLLCTDGLTRYFGETGPEGLSGSEALERVLGRQGVAVQGIAGQLTAHSRPDGYDDDTTVALAEVTALVKDVFSARPGGAAKNSGGRLKDDLKEEGGRMGWTLEAGGGMREAGSGVPARVPASKLPHPASRPHPQPSSFPEGQKAESPVELQPAARPLPISSEDPTVPRIAPPPSARTSPGGVIAALLVGAGLMAAGFWAGAHWWPEKATVGPAAASNGQTAAGAKQFATPDQLAHLPTGNVILLDSLGNRVFALSTRTGAPGTEPLDLEALRVGSNGRLTPAGHFSLDPAHGELSDEQGNRYPVEVDGARIRVLQGGSLVINSRPAGAAVTVDGRAAGAAPQKLRLPAGVHHVRVEGRNWASENDVDVPAGRSVSLTWGPQ